MNHIDLEQAIHKTLPNGGYINLDPYHSDGIKIDGVVSVESLRLIVDFMEGKEKSPRGASFSVGSKLSKRKYSQVCKPKST